MRSTVQPMRSVTISQAIASFLAEKEARSEHTSQTYGFALDYFMRYLSEHGLSANGDPALLTPALASGFNTWLSKQKWQKGKAGPVNPLSMRTRQLYIRALLGFYKHLVTEGVSSFDYNQYEILSDKLVKATKFDLPSINGKTPDEDIVQAILVQAKIRPELDKLSDGERQRRRLIYRRNLAMVLCLYSGGMRVGELVGLRYRDMDRQHCEFSVIGKGRRGRRVKVSGETWIEVLAYLRERDGPMTDPDAPVFARHDRQANELSAITTRSAQRIIYRLATEAGVFTRFNLTPHSFRHYFATRFLAQTGDLALTQDALGHADPATTRIYAETSDERRRQEHDKVFGDNEDRR